MTDSFDTLLYKIPKILLYGKLGLRNSVVTALTNYGQSQSHDDKQEY